MQFSSDNLFSQRESKRSLAGEHFLTLFSFSQISFWAFVWTLQALDGLQLRPTIWKFLFVQSTSLERSLFIFIKKTILDADGIFKRSTSFDENSFWKLFWATSFPGKGNSSSSVHSRQEFQILTVWYFVDFKIDPFPTFCHLKDEK